MEAARTLRVFGKRSGEALRKALSVKTIRDLATNDSVLKAQGVLRLAEGQAGVRKRVVTEQQPRTVPVEREELREVDQPDGER